ncbi:MULTISPECIES: peptidoglycan D,D-transpeptidase FtsI family protein [Nocardiopsis]|uniref:Peptidoglycan glycosyltransferase n=1 Tax=Nocardiopsis sinuspersici TaxID=501010 RepID=A0A1V3C5R6_9ACTN|nr:MULTISPECIES: penicillin-binding protein 2 [Nocardiopsis]NYH52642.1 peptidoglycan glycosyltransferase [Nocardiopsis sinuspersici]OOC56085.1 peptidoglycan glycosyltransferase [Nocardiopsis sinuspersici]
MNTPIRRLSIFSLFLLLVLMLNVTWIQGFQAEAIRDDPLNTRKFSERLSEQRGPIQVAGENVAYSENIAEEGKQPRYQRLYEGTPLYTPIVGSFRTYGASGVESAANSLLDGTDDRLAVRNFRDIITGREPEGAQVQLTLDPAVQKAAYQGFEALGGKNGAAVALDPETGAILGAVSYPSYDANKVSSITDLEAAVQNYTELENDPRKPLLNRAFNELYPPGSTFKVVTASAAMEYLDAGPDSTKEAPDVLDLGAPLPNATGGGTCNGGQPDTLAHSIKISCNTSMANWAIDIGGENLSEQATAYGFNREDPLEVPMEVTPSLAPVETDPNILGRAGIGQSNVQATPLQMAMVASGVANSGEVMRPYVVDTVRDSDLSVVTQTTPESYSQAVSASTAEDLTEMMVGVTSQGGSGTNAAIPGVEVAGKTGTAETGPDSPTHNLFIGFAPADDPQIAVAVVVEFGGGSGNELAAPIARQMMEAVVL